jgi:hypothetical protein
MAIVAVIGTAMIPTGMFPAVASAKPKVIRVEVSRGETKTVTLPRGPRVGRIDVILPPPSVPVVIPCPATVVPPLPPPIVVVPPKIVGFSLALTGGMTGIGGHVANGVGELGVDLRLRVKGDWHILLNGGVAIAGQLFEHSRITPSLRAGFGAVREFEHGAIGFGAQWRGIRNEEWGFAATAPGAFFFGDVNVVGKKDEARLVWRFWGEVGPALMKHWTDISYQITTGPGFVY